jgi:hypothetical protein
MDFSLKKLYCTLVLVPDRLKKDGWNEWYQQHSTQFITIEIMVLSCHICSPLNYILQVHGYNNSLQVKLISLI